MKKIIVSALMTLTTFSALASCPDFYLERQVKQPSSDRRLEFTFKGEVALGEALYDFRGNEFFFNDYRDQTIHYYKATGSEHSGWFELALIVDERNCNILEEITVYSE